MKKTFLTLVAIVTFGFGASATTTADTTSKAEQLAYVTVQNQTPATKQQQPTTDQVVPVTDLTKIPQVVKDAVAKDYAGSIIKTAAFNQTKKTYLLDIVIGTAKETTKVEYTEKGVKAVK